jgi:hypothetical protein
MKNLIVSPKKIITSEISISDINKLNEYYQKILSGKKVMPVTLIKLDLSSIEVYKKELQKKQIRFQ